MRLLYNFLLTLALPAILLKLMWRGRRAPAYRNYIGERLGRINPQLPSGAVVIHAVSVGETIAAKPLIVALKKKYPACPIVLTHMTPTGRAMGKRLFGESIFQHYLPYDYPWAIRPFLDKVAPKLVLMMETEVWPNWVLMCHKKETPIFLVNARLSGRSLKGYQRAKWLLPNIWPLWTEVLTQTEAHRKRFLELGVKKEAIQSVGQMKFDMVLDSKWIAEAKALQESIGLRAVWLIASSHEAEEALLAAAFAKISHALPQSLLIWVPRHPERFKPLYDALSKEHRVARRSQGDAIHHNTAIYLCDTMGDLLTMMAVAQVVVMAGSFKPIGGHNPLEPALLEKAIVTGLYTHNFEEIYADLKAKKALVEADSNTLAQVVISLLQNDQEASRLGQAAHGYLKAHQGATLRTMEAIQQYLR